MSLTQSYTAGAAREFAHKPRVRTLDRSAFNAACSLLMQYVLQDCRPDLLIGIRTGGLVVAEAMASSVPDAAPVMALTSRRASTGAKSRLPWLPVLLKQLPEPVVDGLRVVEHRVLTPRRRARPQGQHVDPAEIEQIRQHLTGLDRPGVAVVVDDAVDSGVTLAAVLAALRAVCPAAVKFRSAVITVTAESPLAEPDYALYRGDLCRFPWSFDAAD